MTENRSPEFTKARKRLNVIVLSVWAALGIVCLVLFMSLFAK